MKYALYLYKFQIMILYHKQTTMQFHFSSIEIITNALCCGYAQWQYIDVDHNEVVLLHRFQIICVIKLSTYNTHYNM